MIRSINKAMTKRRDAIMAGEKEQGFTLIELMVVIIIIGILTAIAIPVFLNQRQQAWDASVKADLSNIAIAAETYATANNGSYTGLVLGGNSATPTAGSLRAAYSLKTTTGNLFKLGTVTGTSYVVTAYNPNSTNSKTYTLTTGTVTGPASSATTITSPGD